jgi:hypothetical protein
MLTLHVFLGNLFDLSYPSLYTYNNQVINNLSFIKNKNKSILLLNEDVNVDYPTSENNYHSRWSPCLREVCFYYFTECDMILKFIECSFRFFQFDCHLAMTEVDIWIRETSTGFQSKPRAVCLCQMTISISIFLAHCLMLWIVLYFWVPVLEIEP